MSHDADVSQKGDSFKEKVYEKLSQQMNEYISTGVRMMNNIDLSTVNRNIIDVNFPSKENTTMHKLVLNSSLCRDSCGIATSRILNLSKKGRITLMRWFDIIESIDIGCFYPEQIESVTIYGSVLLPSDLEKINLDDFNIFDMDVETRNSYPDLHYIPLKTFTGTTHIDFPINSCHSRFIGLSIEVKFNQDNIEEHLKNGCFSVKINGIFINDTYYRCLINPQPIIFQ